METFESFGIQRLLLDSLQKLNFTEPTPIQQEAIPVALQGHDILGTAQTGTGKTGAFGIPMIEKLLLNPQGLALVLTPTRELATQVMQSLKGLIGAAPIKTALIIGGEDVVLQLNQLRMKPRLIVGTPGRINDLLSRGALKLDKTSFLVLDEMDRMLDMGFSIQIEEILKYVPKERQTLLFSATLPKNIIKLAELYLRDPKRIAVGSVFNPIDRIKQEVLHIAEGEKYKELCVQLDKREGAILVFVKTKYATERMAQKLKDENYDVQSIHGDLRHNKRERVIKAFRNKRYRILIATDVVARGLDIPHIEHVINYDLPQSPEDYIHRIGRTARAGAKGEAICFVSPAEKGKWHAIECLMNPGLKVDKSLSQNNRIKRFSSDGKSKSKFPWKNNAPEKKKFSFNHRNGHASTESVVELGGKKLPLKDTMKIKKDFYNGNDFMKGDTSRGVLSSSKTRKA